MASDKALSLKLGGGKMTFEYEVQGNYGYGWELETTEVSRTEALKRLKEYRENAPEAPHRIKKVKNNG